MNYEEAVDYLYSRIPPTTGTMFPGNVGLKRTFLLMNALGNPQDAFPVIHIAGTAGKGSTSYMIASIMQAAGYKVGLHVSPHVVSIRERIQVNGGVISKQDFAQTVEKVRVAVEKVSVEQEGLGAVTYFEALIGVTYEYFKDSGLDIAVIETGMGGTYDATNVVNSIASVITPIGFDHEKVLGSTLTQIAGNKAGIIKKSNCVMISSRQLPESMIVLEKAAKGAGVKTAILGKNFHVSEYSMQGRRVQFSYTKKSDDGISPEFHLNDVELSLVGLHQAENAACSISACLSVRDGYPKVSEDSIRKGLKSVQVPARFESIYVDGVEVIIDGAHNPDKVGALVSTIKEAYGAAHGTAELSAVSRDEEGTRKEDEGRGEEGIGEGISDRVTAKVNVALLLAFKRGKNVVKMLAQLKPVANFVGITQFTMQTDTGAGLDMCTPVEEVFNAAEKVSLHVDVVEKDSVRAFNELLSYAREAQLKRGERWIICCTGSFFLASEIRAYLVSEQAHES